MDPNQSTSEPEQRWATILFADITGFTSLNERFDIGDAYSIVSASLKLLDGIARKHGGTVDKYVGDAVLAYFGAPLSTDDHAERAVAAAIAIQREAEERNNKPNASNEMMSTELFRKIVQSVFEQQCVPLSGAAA